MGKGFKEIFILAVFVFSGCSGTEWGNGNEGEKLSEKASGPFINLKFVAKELGKNISLSMALHRVDAYTKDKQTEEIGLYSSALKLWLN